MSNLDNTLKSREITFSTNVCLVKAMVFPVVMYGCESCTIKLSVKELMFLNCDFGTPKNKVSHCFPIYCHEVMGLDAMILVFWMLSFKSIFSLYSFTFIKRLFSSSLSAIGWCHLHIWVYWYFSQQSWFQLVLPPDQGFSWRTLHIS